MAQIAIIWDGVNPTMYVDSTAVTYAHQIRFTVTDPPQTTTIEVDMWGFEDTTRAYEIALLETVEGPITINDYGQDGPE